MYNTSIIINHYASKESRVLTNSEINALIRYYIPYVDPSSYNELKISEVECRMINRMIIYGVEMPSLEHIVTHGGKFVKDTIRMDKQNTKEGFMDSFRNDEFINQLTNEERMEIFRTVLPCGEIITKELIEELLSDYEIHNLQIAKTQ